jgi:hypothetical protein
MSIAIRRQPKSRKERICLDRFPLFLIVLLNWETSLFRMPVVMAQ